MEAKDKTGANKDSSLRQDENKSPEVSAGHTAHDKPSRSLTGWTSKDKSPDKIQKSFCRDAQAQGFSEEKTGSTEQVLTPDYQDLTQEPGVHQAEPNMQNEEPHQMQTELDKKLQAEVDERKQ